MMAVIQNPPQLTRGAFQYTFTDIQAPKGGRYVFANLAKYQATGQVQVVEPAEHVAKPADVANLQLAKSPFVYLPRYEAVAFQHVWNKIEIDTFQTVFAELINEGHQRFFAECKLEPIADMATFIIKLSRLKVISKVEATVHPPNPLFGPLWRPLKDYMRTRNAAEVQVKESAADDNGLATNLSALAQQASGPTEPLGLIDAAVMMAADGYGRAKVEGKAEGRKTVVRTQDSQVHFRLDREPAPDVLYDEAGQVLVRIERDRRLTHE